LWRRVFYCVQTAVLVGAIASIGWSLVQEWDVARLFMVPAGGAESVSLALLLAGGLLPYALALRILLRAGGVDASWASAMLLMFVPMLGKYLPGKVWSLGILIALARRTRLDASAAVRAALWFSGLWIVAGLLVSLAALAGGTAALSCAGAASAIVYATLSLAGFRTCPLISQLVRAFAVLVVTWLILGIWFGVFAETGLGADIGSWARLGGWFVLAQVLGFISVIAPAGLGVREGLLLVLLSGLGSQAEVAALVTAARIWQTLAECALACSAFLTFRLFEGFRAPEDRTRQAIDSAAALWVDIDVPRAGSGHPPSDGCRGASNRAGRAR